MADKKNSHPLMWVPSLYLAMGIPNAAASVMSKTLYKNLGVSNTEIVVATSSIYLPWVLKPLWAPFLEPYLTKRRWVLATEFLMAIALALVAFVLPLPGFFRASLAIFWIVGFASATQDIAADAIYLTTLTPRRQASFMGVQGMAWNAGAILASGLLVTLTGYLHDDFGFEWTRAWIVVMVLLGVILAALGAWHFWQLPEGEPSALHGGGLAGAARSLRECWVTFFQKKSIWMMLVVVFMYRFGEGFIENFGQLFVLDSRSVGGLGFTNQQIGNIYTTLGTIGFLAGAFLGGLFSAKFTLRRTFVLLAISLNVPHLTYYYLSHALPDNLGVVSAAVVIEKFGFGFGSVGHMLYMMQQVAPGPFKMTHYAFATGVMALTKMSTGWFSAILYELVHHQYPTFFLVVLLLSIPPIVLAFFAPFPQNAEEGPPPAPG
jgi:PAT family beta-lactamase induction signal transducer AmpG